MSTENTSTLCWAVIVCAVILCALLNAVSFFFLKCLDEKSWYGTLPFFYILPICNTVFVIAILVYGYFTQLLNNQRHEFDKTMEERKELRGKQAKKESLSVTFESLERLFKIGVEHKVSLDDLLRYIEKVEEIVTSKENNEDNNTPTSK